MSKIQVNEIVNHFDTGAPDCPKGLTVTGVTTSVNISATNISVIGVSTLGNVVVGGATTDLVVNGNARVTGILTVGTASVTLNGNNGVVSGINTINSVSFPSTGPLSNRNLIINGAMQVAQRGTSATSVTGYIRRCDRFLFAPSNLGTWTVEQSGDAPVGFSSSLKITCTTADASPAASDYCVIQYYCEAQDFQLLNYGTSNAEQVVISFYVKSNKTGSASFGMWQHDNSSRQFTTSFTINTADTWEYKTIVIPGDTSGQIDNDNGIGLVLDWWLNSGSTFTGGTHAAAWEASTQSNRNATNLGVGGATSDYFQLTGVQLELGNQATPFEHRSFGDELKRCERYYEKSYTYASPPGTATSTGALEHRKSAVNSGYTNFNIRFGTRKRATPTIGLYNTNNSTEGQIRSDGANVTADDANTNEMGFRVNTTPAQGASVIQKMHYTADAEL